MKKYSLTILKSNRRKSSTMRLWGYLLSSIAAYHPHFLAMQSPLSCRTSTSPETSKRSYQLPSFLLAMLLDPCSSVHWVKLLVGNPSSFGLSLFLSSLHLGVPWRQIGPPFSSFGLFVVLWELRLRRLLVVFMQTCFLICEVVVVRWRCICRYVVITYLIGEMFE